MEDEGGWGWRMLRGGFGKGRKVPEILCAKGRERRKKKKK